MSEITLDDVQHIANLSRLEFSETEIDQFRDNLARILQYIEKLNELDTEDVAPTSHVIPIRNVTKPDLVNQIYTRDEMLANAPKEIHGYFEVPKVID